MLDSRHSLQARALTLHRRGQLHEAQELYIQLLKDDPNDANVLGLLGVLHEQKGDASQARHFLERSVDDRDDVPVLYRNLNNLLGLLVDLGARDDARATLGQISIPRWPNETTPDETQINTITSLIETLRILNEYSTAIAVADQIAPLFQHDLTFATLRSHLLHDAGRLDEARSALNQDFGADNENPALHALRGALAFEAGDRPESSQAASRLASALPTYLAPAQPSQKFVLAVLNFAPDAIRDFRSLEAHHYSGNFPSQLATELAGQYRFLSIFPESPSVAAALSDLPRPAMGLNNLANAENLLIEGKFARICSAVDGLGFPVLNHPRQVAEVTRQKNAERFSRLDGVIASRITRYLSSKSLRGLLVSDIEAQTAYPMILRTVFHQMGQGTWLVRDRKELNQALDATDEQQVYVIQYFDLRHRNGFYRRIRAAFVDKVWTIIRVDYSDHWNVRGRRERQIVDLYRKHPDLVDLADKATLDPDAILDRAALDKLEAVAEAIPLDIFGMDFDITDEGRLAIFEANATMNFLSNAQGGLAYPQEAQRRLTKALSTLFDKTASR